MVADVASGSQAERLEVSKRCPVCPRKRTSDLLDNEYTPFSVRHLFCCELTVVLVCSDTHSHSKLYGMVHNKPLSKKCGGRKAMFRASTSKLLRARSVMNSRRFC
jgi:hypothetical protein